MRFLTALIAGALFGSGLLLSGMANPTVVLTFFDIGGAAVFGLGWGLSGICPGPGLLPLTGLSIQAIVFVSAMVVGKVAAAFVLKKNASA